ncbi:MAG: radical SAM protein [Actinobacteria bacterium]|nr:radical SAM protein [Actinomycetota bacterium]
MLLKQISCILFFSSLVSWKKSGLWFLKHSFKSLPVAAGAIGMGCIGFPNHPVFEITGRCNLSCIHCHTSGGSKNTYELSTLEVRKLIDGLQKIPCFRILVFTGGEPFVREDFLEILEYSKYRGFINIIATNGTLITEGVAKAIKKAGVAGVAISLDSTVPDIHNRIRQNKNAYSLAMAGIEAVKKTGILLQINTTAMEYNFDNLADLVKLSDNLGSGIMLMYQLVPVGRGCAIKEASLDLGTNEKLLKYLAEVQKSVSVIVETVAGPQYWPFLMEKESKNNTKYIKFAEKIFHGCTAGRGLVYIKPDGDVWPCPFVELKAGNIRERSIDLIWNDSEIFIDLRNRQKLKGKCGSCKYNVMCGGCRGRALALSGDLMEEDKSCFI